MSEKPKTYDDAFKLLASQDAEALLLLLGELQPGEKAEITPLERELRISTKLPDQPYRVVSARGERAPRLFAALRAFDESDHQRLGNGRKVDYRD